MMSSEEITEVKGKLKELEERIGKLEHFLAREEGKSAEEPSIATEGRMEKLCEDAGITEEELKCVFDFEEEDLSLIATVEGKSEAVKQFKASVGILTAYHYCYRKDEIRSQDLRKKLEWSGIRSLGNLSANLANYKQLIRPKGKSGSPQFSYKITFPGIKKGLEIIREWASA